MKAADIKKIVLNFTYIALSRLVDFAIPIIVYPYLVSVVGEYNYGKYAFAYSLIFYLLNITQYGFGLSAVREIAINRNDTSALNRTFSDVFTAKIYLLLFTIFLLIIIVLIVPSFSKEPFLYIPFVLLLIGDVLFCSWFFQGLEEMKAIMIVNICSKSLFILSCLLFVKTESDYLFIGIYQSVGFVLCGIITFGLLIMKRKCRYSWSSFVQVKRTLINGFSSFLTLFIPTLYSNTSLFLLGMVGSPVAVAYFDGAKKVNGGFNVINDVVTSILYPYGSANKDKSVFKYIQWIYLVIGAFTSILMFMLAPVLSSFLVKSDEIVVLIRILSLSPLFMAIRSAYGVNYLLMNGMDKLYMRIVIVGSIAGLGCALFCIPKYSSFGAAFVIIIAQFSQAILSLRSYLKQKL